MAYSYKLKDSKLCLTTGSSCNSEKSLEMLQTCILERYLKDCHDGRKRRGVNNIHASGLGLHGSFFTACQTDCTCLGTPQADCSSQTTQDKNCPYCMSTEQNVKVHEVTHIVKTLNVGSVC